jgi:formylglycine-generating enzyme required for sulfatase activity
MLRAIPVAFFSALIAACPNATPNEDDKPTTGEVPSGTFWMGCNEAVDGDCETREYPYHEVTLSTFEIDKREVSVGEYRACVNDGACTEPPVCADLCNWGTGDREDYPINNINWHQANAYCAWAGKRLCTEAEWEKAARGDDGRLFPWGNQALSCDRAVMDAGGGAGCGRGGTLPVGSKPDGASPYGMFDMSGNVWEWVADYYSSTTYQDCAGGCSDPTGPSSGEFRVMRGGCFVNSTPANLRASTRVGFRANFADDGVGVRCCK